MAHATYCVSCCDYHFMLYPAYFVCVKLWELDREFLSEFCCRRSKLEMDLLWSNSKNPNQTFTTFFSWLLINIYDCQKLQCVTACDYFSMDEYNKQR